MNSATTNSAATNSTTMDGLTMHADWLLVIAWDLPTEIPPHTIYKAMEDVQRRLDCTCRYLDLGTATGIPNDSAPLHDAFSTEATLRADFRTVPTDSTARVIIVPLGITTIPLGLLRSAWWFASLPCSLPCYLAEPLTHRELGQWIAHCQTPNGSPAPVRVSLLTDANATTEGIESAVSTAYWASRKWPIENRDMIDVEDAVRVSATPQSDVNGSMQLRNDALSSYSPEQCTGRIPWRTELHHPNVSTSERLPVRVCNDQHTEPWDWCQPSSIANWLVLRYLSAVRSRPLPIAATTDWFEMRALDAEWCELNQLQRSMDTQLPTEYSGKLDSVRPTSMGSASLRYDADGLVPWDQIWTSFCDLAMAGGPPHRGKLLEATPAESIAKSPDRTAAVVLEIRRGIGLASGLTTLDSPYPGWVAIACDDESMAAWLLRAILVENVVVRREGSVLYVPAGPEYRVEKEIKNVITSVAKTVHYWRAHLRSRQPPKPL